MPSFLLCPEVSRLRMQTREIEEGEAMRGRSTNRHFAKNDPGRRKSPKKPEKPAETEKKPLDKGNDLCYSY